MGRSDARGTIPDVFGAPIRVHDMFSDDLGIAHVPTPVETGDLILIEQGEYRVLDVIPLEDEQSPLYALVRAQPAHVRPRSPHDAPHGRAAPQTPMSATSPSAAVEVLAIAET